MKTIQKVKIKVDSWKELEKHGVQTEEGLYIPMGVHGFKNTKIFFDEYDEQNYIYDYRIKYKKFTENLILAVGI